MTTGGQAQVTLDFPECVIAAWATGAAAQQLAPRDRFAALEVRRRDRKLCCMLGLDHALRRLCPDR
jgi:hypothetical protein